MRQWLRVRPEQNIVLVAHGDILRHIIEEEYPWRNAEVRVFTFDPKLVETDECPLVLEGGVAGTPGYSTDMQLAGKP